MSSILEKVFELLLRHLSENVKSAAGSRALRTLGQKYKFWDPKHVDNNLIQYCR